MIFALLFWAILWFDLVGLRSSRSLFRVYGSRDSDYSISFLRSPLAHLIGALHKNSQTRTALVSFFFNSSALLVRRLQRVLILFSVSLESCKRTKKGPHPCGICHELKLIELAGLPLKIMTKTRT